MKQRIVIIGAGIGGLATAARLSHQGHHVHVVESAQGPGGKMRTLEGTNGRIDIGPTVLTLLPVFQKLYSDIGEDICDHIALTRQNTLARHWWPDGTQFDLHDSFEATHHDITEVFGVASAAEFETYFDNTKQLFESFDKPVMKAAAPSLFDMIKAVSERPDIISKMHPHRSLSQHLEMQFSDPKLRQLFGRYATYVGGIPQRSPALLSLVWQAEAQGVWTIQGGMNALAQSLETIARTRGAAFTYNTYATEIHTHKHLSKQVSLSNRQRLDADIVVFNGDPRALSAGRLGQGVSKIAPTARNASRSLSAYVWGFEATAKQSDLAHHNVFFADTPNSEFDDIERGLMPSDPTLYVCAQDRGKGKAIPEIDRFEIILNAPPLSKRHPMPEDFDTCKTTTLNRLKHFGLDLETTLARENLTMPQDFEALFPASDGSLYGQSPHGLTATLKRPKCTTKIKNLFLVGGGVHPGAGVPMATLCAQLAVEEIGKHLTST